MNIQNIIQQSCLDNPIPYFFDWIRNSDYKMQQAILEVLEYYYLNGFLQFKQLEWGEKIKIDYRDKNVTKPYALLIQSVYNLCKECHALQDVSGIRIYHSNAYRWFTYCLLELILVDFIILTTSEKIDYFYVWNNRLKILKSIDYPVELGEKETYNPYVMDKTFNLCLLIESAQSLRATNPNFINKYWQPFIKACQAITDLKNDKYLQPVRLKKDGVETKLNGKGRYRKTK